MTNTVIITAASEGIGKATALEFARHEYNVVLAARQSDRLEAAASQVRAIGRDALAICVDVTDPKQVDALVEKAIAHFGTIDVLINLVDKAIHNPILEKPEDVAVAIWKAVKYQRSDMLVGSARLSKVAYQVFPGLMQSLYQRVLGMRARHYGQ
ncbi:SDR family NAD(P)-dependent oxidoreductase [Brasilonema bromeliae]|uniref:Short-chain dehydrogenase/reductase SDR n=1 Tax=Brasilonema bromeliae SPC951 TaxID=385972 RepID=A0ABX1P2D5_9CYAN|nr:SDR family NAD(P)-dependent oxidoreductase [Brasilonema bromeliae]NMG18489.1 hypothetical protein [Brasilonema bromeliae SPC951]